MAHPSGLIRVHQDQAAGTFHHPPVSEASMHVAVIMLVLMASNPVQPDPPRPARSQSQVDLAEARLLYQQGEYAAAAARFESIVDRFPQSPEAESAARLCLDSLNQAKDLPALEAAARRLRENRLLVKRAPALKKTLNLLLPQILLNKAERLSHNDPVAGAEAYMLVAREFPKATEAPMALYNAVVLFEKGGRADQAEQARTMLLQRHPENRYAVMLRSR